MTFPTRRAARRRRRILVMGSIAGVVASVALVAGLVVVSSHSTDPDVHLGDDRFVVGRADRLAPVVRRTGPLLFGDLLGRDRDIFVQHLGAPVGRGWVAFEAHAPGAPRRCQLQWRAPARVFVDPCTQRRYAATGAGLVAYATTVDSAGRVAVDLRARVVSPSTTARR